jgi:hypothetical protein
MLIQIQYKDGPKIVNLNRRKAIRERCMNCTGWSYKQVTDCTFDDCPLHPFRSGKGKQNPKKRNIAIRKYCLWCMCGQSSEVSKCTSTDCPLFPYRKTTTDRSVEIPSSSIKRHIRPISGGKIENKGHPMHGALNG